MRNRLLIPLLVLGVSLGTACTATQRSSGGSGSYGETLGQQVARHDQELKNILSQMGQVEQVLPGQAEMWSQMQTMRQELNSVHGQLADLNNQMSGAGAGELSVLKERVNRTEVILRRMGAQLAMDTRELDAPLPNSQTMPQNTSTGTYHPAGYDPAADPAVSSTPEGPQAQPMVSEGGTPQARDIATNLYQSGIKLFDQKKYKEAVISFKDFANTYPKHNLAGNAYFWQGESYFQMEDYARAALAYQEVILKYPGSHQMPASMLKQGISLYKVNKKLAGKERLEELIKKYPKSPESTRAKKYIKENP